jgi:hypothetical protein
MKADVTDVVDAVGKKRLDTFVEPAQQGGHRHGESVWCRDQAAVPPTLDESLVDKRRDDGVFDQVGALLGNGTLANAPR